MTSIDRLVRPDLPEKRMTHLSEGVIVGWISGIITDLNDPEKLGRVRVQCPQLQQNSDLPNTTDGWVWVTEEFTNNSLPGGSHRLLHLGTQVALLPMYGDPLQMLLLGCLPSRVDQPHPSMNRNEQVYGSATPNDVIHVHNDADQSRLSSYPHGVTQHIGGDGSITLQTRDQGRLQIQQDGTTRIENPQAYTVVTKDGDVHSQSKAGATSVLHSNGTVDVTAAGVSQLHLDDLSAQIKAPLSSLSKTIESLQKQVTGVLGSAHQILAQIGNLSKSVLGDNTALNGMLGEADQLLKQLDKSLSQGLSQGQSVLGKLQTFSGKDLGQSLMPQINAVLEQGLDKFMPQVNQFLAGAGHLDVKQIAETVQGLLPPEMATKLRLESLTPILEGLRHSPELQAQAILSATMPNGFADISNLVTSGLHLTLGKVNDTISQPLSSDLADRFAEAKALWDGSGSFVEFLKRLDQNSTRYTELIQELEKRGRAVVNNTPDALKQHIDSSTISDLLTMGFDGLDHPMQVYSGAIALGMVNQSADQIQQLQSNAAPLAPLQTLVSSIIGGNPKSIADAVQSLSQLPAFKDLANLDLSQIIDVSKLTQPLDNLPADLSKLDLSGLKDLIPSDLSHLNVKALDPLIKNGMEQLNNGLQKLMKDGLGNLNQITSFLPKNISGAIVRAANIKGAEFVEATTSALERGARMLVQQAEASLHSPLSHNTLFAGIAGAGAKTPWGEWGLGEGGSSMFSAGQMAMRVLQGGGQSAGLRLHPMEGASLSSFYQQDWHWNDPDQKKAWTNENASVNVNGDTATIQSVGAAGEIQHQIEVSSKGIFLNNISLEVLLALPTRYAALEARLAALEAAGALLGGAVSG